MDVTTAVPEAAPERVRADCRLMRRAASRLGMPYLLRRVALVVITVAVFVFVANLILNYGRTVTYSALGAPDAAAVAFLTRINPYLWWALVVILGLFVFFWLKAAWSDAVAQERAVAVPADTLQGLAGQLCPSTLAVMRWVWSDRSDPFSIGDLRRSAAEARGGRIDKLRLVNEQEALLSPVVVPVAQPRTVSAPAGVESLG